MTQSQYDRDLLKSVREHNPQNVKICLDRGADIEARNSKGETALYLAASYKQVDREIIAMLIDAGADVNARANNGMTILTNTKSHEATLELISAGADLDLACSEGNTPLHWAVLWAKHEEKFGNDKVSEALIKTFVAAGADLEKKNAEGHTVVSLAKSEGMGDLAEKLHRYTLRERRWQAGMLEHKFRQESQRHQEIRKAVFSKAKLLKTL